MKKLIIILIGIFFLQCDTARAQYPQPGEYRPDANIDKFTGAWTSAFNGETLTIKLKKVKHLNKMVPYYGDILMGCLQYKKGSLIVQDDLLKFDDVGENARGSLFGWGENDPLIAKFLVKDPANKKMEWVYMTYIPGSTPTITWELKRREEVIVPPAQPTGVTLPYSLILTKQ